ncbi:MULTISPECIES: LLM class flavin-dependent oxidoreductase [Bradyrhizobium]|jgi:alkanesulfonate monooxygenase|uniref:LLM class flavin-dependent oxidoreductase n=1 Tax=Bradyrhizobium TaxID=374 RepID=UPI000481AF5D|nr:MULTISPECIES: LLM class flavin-dependent oxidoreductase [Bradyrhizobium]MCS3451203.1 alkanesulfonate monooxygenase [Bradyrhizobium elkanii]MCS3566774.1 alkanesulfonate monooxygenase [Bradyrhizobium elkanii]MCW2152502.1 alkanesulfonate monooxygenase [Bradyrhizobium elkanii]MCW2357621.1 alkanesulfonate monooxygenase [Bradyrhizobium elkanii]MCW2376232.1 alkanesulfonate monooxygenase [Bradyrhizobium elkanii]
MEVLWYLTGPDGRYPWRADGARKLSYAYFQQLARAVDHLGYTGALLATGSHDAWIQGAALIPYTDNFQHLVAAHPPLLSPTLLAKMITTFDQFSKGRLRVNIVNGDAKLMAQYGVHLSHDERYAYTDEYLTVLTALLRGETVNFKGRHIHVVDAGVPLPPVQRPHVPLWFGGSSPAAHEVAAKHIDTYLSWGETPEQAEAKIREVKALATRHGRAGKIKFGIRLYAIVRETEQAAWAAAQDLYDHMDERAIAGAQAYVAGIDSVGQQRMSALHGGRKPKDLRELEIAPNLWAGIGLVRHGPGTALVGSPAQVLARIQDYRDAGIEVLIVSGMPLLEEAYRFAELVLPHLPVDRAVETGVTSAFTKDRDAAWQKTA